MKWVSREYQGLMVDHMLNVERGALWAGMGLGKTSASLAAIDGLQYAGMGPVLVCAPKRVAQSTWPDEVIKWDRFNHLDVIPIVGSREQRLAAVRKDRSIFTINYENLPWLIEELDGQWPFAMVLPDESTKLKGFRLRKGTKRSTALARMARRTPRWQNLTGTPAPNGLVDLWGQHWFCDFGMALGRTYEAFKSRWFMPERASGDLSHARWIPQPYAEEEIYNRLRPSCLTIRAKDWFDLREPIVNRIRLELPAKAYALYRQMEREMFTEIAGHGVEAFNAAAKRNICEQIASGAVYVDGSGSFEATDPDGNPRKKTRKWVEIHDQKLQALDEVLTEAAGMPVLVSYKFVHSRERILREFPKLRFLDDDPQTIRDWDAGKLPGLVTHPASAGHGLNLQDGGNILYFFDADENLEYHDQIVERIGPVRQLQSGHDRPVFLHYGLARKTVDEIKMARIQTKRSVQDLLLEAMRHRGNG